MLYKIIWISQYSVFCNNKISEEAAGNVAAVLPHGVVQNNVYVA